MTDHERRTEFDHLDDNASDAATPPDSNSGDDILQKARAEADEMKDAWLRARAEVENVRRQGQADVARAHKYAIEKFAEDLLAVSKTPGEITGAGLRNDVSVGLQYLASWLNGSGAVAIFNLMEDAATAEIARSQVWQWLHNDITLDDTGEKVTPDLVARIIDEELAKVREQGGDFLLAEGGLLRFSRFGYGKFPRRVFADQVLLKRFIEHRFDIDPKLRNHAVGILLRHIVQVHLQCEPVDLIQRYVPERRQNILVEKPDGLRQRRDLPLRLLQRPVTLVPKPAKRVVGGKIDRRFVRIRRSIDDLLQLLQ